MAAAASRLGLRVAFAGILGNDIWSRFVLDQLATEGVSDEFMFTVDRELGPARSLRWGAMAWIS